MRGQRTDKRIRTTAEPEAAAASRLPDHLVAEVLRRLPARSLARSRCVCRSWHAEISSRAFQESHHDLAAAAAAAARFVFLPPAPTHSSYLTIWRGRSRRPAYLPITCNNCPRAVGSKPCRGVVLVTRSCSSEDDYVCNPTTGEVLRLLPPPPPPPQYQRQRRRCCPTAIGIGFDAAAGEFKVVKVRVEPEPDNKLYCMVLTVGDGRGWRSPSPSPAPAAAAGRGHQEEEEEGSFAVAVAGFADDARIDEFVHPVVADGCLHWSFSREHLDKPHGILSFSLAGESFRRALPQPPFAAADLIPYDCYSQDQHHQQGHQLWRTRGVTEPAGKALAELDGRLCIMRDVRHRAAASGGGDGGSLLFEIWKLQDYETGSWTMDYRIDLTPAPGHMTERLTAPWRVVPLRYLDGGGGGEKRKLLLATTAQEAHVYDPDSGTLRTVASAGAIAEGGGKCSPEDSLRLMLHEESLARFPGMKQGKADNIEFVKLE